jgi:hypothetical protein
VNIKLGSINNMCYKCNTILFIFPEDEAIVCNCSNPQITFVISNHSKEIFQLYFNFEDNTEYQFLLNTEKCFIITSNANYELEYFQPDITNYDEIINKITRFLKLKEFF